jgi:hypothetical protein
MKILILQHTLWIEMMGLGWKDIQGVEIVTLPLPIVDWDNAMRMKIATIIPEFAKAHDVKMIIDVNGLGILPVDEARTIWTTDLVEVPWVTWWWDSPRHIWQGIASYGYPFDKWKRALEQEKVKHFIWDEVLGKEFEHYINKAFTLLPSATHPGMFHPDAKKFANQNFEKRDVSFLGTYYTGSSNVSDSLVQAHIEHPYKSFLELTEMHCKRSFSLLRNGSGFSNEVIEWVNQINLKTGILLRNHILNDIAISNLSYRFIGFNFPDTMEVSTDTIYSPVDLVACFHASTVVLDLGNTQSFSGTAMRCYEVMAAGAVLACNRALDFDPTGRYDGELYFRFRTVEELSEIVKRLNSSPDLKTRIGMNARQFIIENHTWNHRLLSIIN